MGRDYNRVRPVHQLSRLQITAQRDGPGRPPVGLPEGPHAPRPPDSMRRMLKRMALSLAAAAVLASAGLAQQPASIANLKTTAEASEFKSTSTYEEVVKFMKAVDAASPLVFYTTYGKTYEGREMPMAVVGAGLKDASPAAVRATNRLRVHIQGNIHAGEVEGKESAQILLREFGLGQHKEWLQSMVFLITPIFNADGN